MLHIHDNECICLFFVRSDIIKLCIEDITRVLMFVLNLLNKEKRSKRGLPSILSLFRNELIDQ